MKDISRSPEKVTDLAYLSELSKGDQHFVDEMIRLFLSENPEEIRMLEEGISERDFQLINLAAHKLRSTLPFVGLDKWVEEEIQEIESLAANNAVHKIEIAPDEDNDIRKIEIVTTNRSVLQRIEKIFPAVKKVCEKARTELSAS